MILAISQIMEIHYPVKVTAKMILLAIDTVYQLAISHLRLAKQAYSLNMGFLIPIKANP